MLGTHIALLKELDCSIFRSSRNISLLTERSKISADFDRGRLWEYGRGSAHAYDAFAASLITRSNVPGATLRKRLFRFRDTAMLIVGL